MPVATARTITLQGAVGHLVDVEADVSQGVVATSLVGRPDASINESRDRCRTAVVNSKLEWPTTRRVTNERPSRSRSILMRPKSSSPTQAMMPAAPPIRAHWSMKIAGAPLG